MTTTAFASLTAAESAFKAIVWVPLLTAGETALFAEIPVLDAPVLGTIDKAVLGLVSDWMFNQLVQFIDVTAIKLVNAELQSKWSSASEALTLIASEQGVTSNAYQQALSTAAADFASWVHTGP